METINYKEFKKRAINAFKDNAKLNQLIQIKTFADDAGVIREIPIELSAKTLVLLKKLLQQYIDEL